MKPSPEFEKFDRTMDDLLKVPHSEIKAKLDAERLAKKSPRRKFDNNKKDEHKTGNDE